MSGPPAAGREAGGLALVGSAGLTSLVSGGLSVPLPFSHRICLVEDTYVAGTTHVPGIDGLVAGLREGQELALVRDKGNPHDRWAIRVLAHATQVGFVPADINEILARLMDGGKSLVGVVGEVERIKSWNKVHMGVFLDD